MEKANIPKIRFDKFNDDWEQRKLGEVLVSLQNNTLSRADLSNETGIAKNVHYGDVLIKFGEVLDVSEEKLPMISDKSVLTKYKASFLQNGDVIVADTAEDSTVGKCSEIAGLNDEVLLSGLHTIPYRPIEKFASGYLGYYLNSSAYHKQLIPLMQGIKVTSISKSAMQDTKIVYPKSMEEQGKIGNYFRNLDHLITLHQSKQINRKYIEKRRISMSGFNKELEFESALIAALQSNGWEKQIIKNPTEDQLIQNWADILFENNREIDRLNDCPLIREEMDELIDQIKTLRTPLALNGFINGKTVSITRKNPDDTLHYGKEVSLKIYDRIEIAAGQSRYQIVEQPII